jgi:hypothetical protein
LQDGSGKCIGIQEEADFASVWQEEVKSEEEQSGQGNGNRKYRDRQ